MTQQLQMQKKPEPQEVPANGAVKHEPQVSYIPADESAPRFDFSRVNRKWGKAWMEQSIQQTRDTVLIDGDPAPGISEAEKRTLMLAKMEAVERLAMSTSNRDALIAQVLVFVPRSWLSADAPESLDWSDPVSQEWILESKSNALMLALQEARTGGN